MSNTLNIEEIKQKMFEKLEPSGWGQKFKPFLFSSDFENIIHTLAELADKGHRFTPPLKQTFRAFEECPLDQLKVVIIGQDPYPQLGVADGVAFSCGNTRELQPSLRYILNEINRTVYNGHPGSTDPDLTRWSKQGILMLNTALSTQVGKIGQHYEIWKPFIAFVLDYLNCNHTGLVYIFLGKQAKEWSEMISQQTNYKLFASHPASAAYNKFKSWDCQDVFNIAKSLVLKNTETLIQW